MENYIGVLDSGVGGLSILSELTKALPKQNFLFFGDTLNMPYGTKTPKEIYNFTKNILDFFVSKGIKTAVFACNTTSAVAYNDLKKDYEGILKIFPLIQTCKHGFVEGLKDNDTVAVLATKATVNSKKYNEVINEINPKINVFGIDCTGFVEIVENRLYNDPDSIKLIKEKLDTVKNLKAKKVILGCTHYPYLIDIFKKYLNDVDYFNPAKYLSGVVKQEANTIEGCGDIVFYVSKDPEQFRLSAKTFFNIQTKINLI